MFWNFKGMEQSFFFISKDIELDRVNLKIPLVISKTVFQSSMVKSHMPMGTIEKRTCLD